MVLDVPTNIVMTENVFGISEEGAILWQVERHVATSTDPINSYVGVSCEGGVVYLGDWGGHCVKIEPLTGRILDVAISK